MANNDNYVDEGALIEHEKNDKSGKQDDLNTPLIDNK